MTDVDLGYLQEIYGIGPVSAKALLRILKLNYKWSSKRDLYKILRKPVIFTQLPEAAQTYLTYMPDRMIPYSVMQKFDATINQTLKTLKTLKIRLIIAGSYRRKKPFSRDIDIVMIQNKAGSAFEKFKEALGSSKYIKILRVYAEGPAKCSVMFRFLVPQNIKKASDEKKLYTIKADIFLTPPNEYLYTLLYATGSGAFNIRMRAQAKRKGYLLNQRGLFKGGVRVENIKNERQLFDIIGVSYRAPTEREIPIKS